VQDDFIVLDVNGDATLCCTYQASEANTVGNFLSTSIDAIQSARRSLCKPCMSFAFPLLANYAVDRLNEIARHERAAFRHQSGLS
jgi:hypothetical protein